MSLLAVVLSVGLTGCETQSATTNVTVEPSAATIRAGESITFTASGGYSYMWSLETSVYGTLSTTSGDTTTYTSIYSPPSSTDTNGVTTITPVTQVLTVRSFIENSSSSNSTPGEWTTEVFITHL